MKPKLVVIVYPDMDRASEMLGTLKELQNEYLIDLEDAAYVTRDKKGKIKLHQSGSLTGAGAAGGAFWGFLIGLLFFVPVAGALIGAGTGALAGKLSDYGIDDKFAKNLGKEIQPDNSAIFMLVRSANIEKVVPAISEYGGKILTTSLAPDIEKKLQDALTKGDKTGMRAHANA